MAKLSKLDELGVPLKKSARGARFGHGPMVPTTCLHRSRRINIRTTPLVRSRQARLKLPRPPRRRLLRPPMSLCRRVTELMVRHAVANQVLCWVKVLTKYGFAYKATQISIGNVVVLKVPRSDNRTEILHEKDISTILGKRTQHVESHDWGAARRQFERRVAQAGVTAFANMLDANESAALPFLALTLQGDATVHDLMRKFFVCKPNAESTTTFPPYRS